MTYMMHNNTNNSGTLNWYTCSFLPLQNSGLKSQLFACKISVKR